MCSKLLGLISMITHLPNRAYPNDSVKSSLFACFSFKCLLIPSVFKTHISKRTKIKFLSICNMFGKIHITYWVCVYTCSGLSCSPSTKQVTRRGTELHLQSNTFQMKRTQVLHFIIISICLSTTHSNSTKERERETRSQTWRDYKLWSNFWQCYIKQLITTTPVYKQTNKQKSPLIFARKEKNGD